MNVFGSFVSFNRRSAASAYEHVLREQARDMLKPKLTPSSFMRDAFRVRGSVLHSIVFPVFCITLWASIVAVANKSLGWHLSNSIMPHISVVVGLLLVFRNATSYDRWYEGRKDIQAMITDIRNVARLVWFNVDTSAKPDVALLKKRAKTAPVLFSSISIEGLEDMSKSATESSGTAKSSAGSADLDDHQATKAFRLASKVRILRLLIAFFVATKHHVRGENGADYDDLHGLLPEDVKKLWRAGQGNGLSTPPISKPIPDEQKGAANLKGAGDVDEDIESGATRKGVASSGRQTPTFATTSTALASGSRISSSSSSPAQSRYGTLRGDTASATRMEEERAYLLDRSASMLSIAAAEGLGTNAISLPLLILHEVGRYLGGARRSGLMESLGPAGFNTLNTLVGDMTQQLGSMERIATTTIPVIYGIHLKQTLMLYLIVLPLTLVGEMGWKMIPLATVVAVTLMGIEGIAAEIEMPFGDDQSDHPLDLYCALLRHEIEYMIAFLPEGVDPE